MPAQSYYCLFICILVQMTIQFSHSASIPEYIQICKRDQDTISECVKNSIEFLRPKLAEGIPELKVPGIEPLLIPELIVDQGNIIRFKAVGKDVKVFGASNFKLKSLSVDLDTLQIRAKIFIPRLEFDGKYDLDARLLVVPIHGKGDIKANASNCNAEVNIQGKLEERDGEEYIKFTSVTTDIDVQDYSVRLTNLFNGNEELGEVANQAINHNKAELLRATRPYVERTCSSLFKKIGNRIAGSFKFDDLLPLP